MEQLEDEVWNSEEGSEGYHDDFDALWSMGPDGEWHPETDTTGEWEDLDDDNAAIDVADLDEYTMDVDPVDQPPADPADEQDSDTNQSLTDLRSPIAQAPRPTSIDLPEDSDDWKRFEILSSAPVDHAFYSSVPSQPSKAFLGRIQREYRALASLPGMLNSLL